MKTEVVIRFAYDDAEPIERQDAALRMAFDSHPVVANAARGLRDVAFHVIMPLPAIMTALGSVGVQLRGVTVRTLPVACAALANAPKPASSHAMAGWKPVETPDGHFPSIAAACTALGVHRQTGLARIRRGEWTVMPDEAANPRANGAYSEASPTH